MSDIKRVWTAEEIREGYDVMLMDGEADPVSDYLAKCTRLMAAWEAHESSGKRYHADHGAELSDIYSAFAAAMEGQFHK